VDEKWVSDDCSYLPLGPKLLVRITMTAVEIGFNFEFL
jgi:hypothetical protein